MSKQIVILVVGVVVLVAAYAAHSFSLAECQKPSGNTRACLDPDDRVASCEGASKYECDTEKEIKLYEINQFPDGTESAQAGRTKTESTNCWRWRGCRWNNDLEKCETSPTDWSSWRVKEKIVNNPDVVCPEA